MTNIDLSQFKLLFNQTSLEYLKKMEEGILKLKENPSDFACIKDMYIFSHSLKSQSLLMGYASLGDTAFTLEKLFRNAKENSTVLAPDILLEIQETIHAVKLCLIEITRGNGEVDLTEKVSSFTKHLEERSLL